MKKIIYINPSMDKSVGIRIWNSPLMNTLRGKPSTLLPRLSAMIMGAVTPDKYLYSYLDEEIEDINFGLVEADLVAITCMTAQAGRAYRIAGEFTKRGIKVVMGGIHVAVCPEEALEHCDAILTGECENAWAALLEDFEAGNMKRIYNAKDYPPVTKLVKPRIDVIKHDRYLCYPIQATRGCPYNCEFCSIEYAAGNKYRMKPVEQVVEEIKEMEEYNKAEFGGSFKKTYYFVDDNLYVNRQYVLDLFRALKDLDIIWHGQGTVNTASDEEVVIAMAESGCKSFGFGFETISPAALKEANKPSVNSVDKYEKAIAVVQKYGIVATGYFVVGFDADDIDVFNLTASFVKKTNMVGSFISLLTPYPGTRLHKRMDGENRIFTRSWEAYNHWTALYTPKNMTADELQLGSYWLGRQVSGLSHVKRCLKEFWKGGPWKNNPRLGFIERLILLGISIKLLAYGRGRQAKFTFWAAHHKNSSDISFIMWQLMRDELSALTYNPKYDFDPAVKRAELIKQGKVG